MRVRLAGRINGVLARETGLSEADYEILAALTQEPGETMRALALRCGLEWEKSRLSHQIRRMEQRGLLRREECPEDNRGSVIRVTDAGRERVEAARLVYEAAIQRYVCDVLTAEQLESLNAIAAAILSNLDDPSTP